jgi:hypothetical protein
VQLDETDWTFDDAYKELEEDIAHIADACRVEETKKMVSAIDVRHRFYFSCCLA